MTKKTLLITLLSALAVAVLVVVANVWRSQQVVRGVEVVIDTDGADSLVSASAVAGLVLDSMPNLTQLRVRDVELDSVAQVAAASPWLRNCEAGTSTSGRLVIHAVQRRPILRVCANGIEYYVDNLGVRVPLSPMTDCDVIVANGHIPQQGKGLNEVYALAHFLDSRRDLLPLFDQIYRDSNGDLYLTPKLGNHVVQIGSPDRLEEKFVNLIALYTQALPHVGWDTYSQISVKYRGQVVGTKRNKS